MTTIKHHKATLYNHGQPYDLDELAEEIENDLDVRINRHWETPPQGSATRETNSYVSEDDLARMKGDLDLPEGEPAYVEISGKTQSFKGYFGLEVALHGNKAEIEVEIGEGVSNPDLYEKILTQEPEVQVWEFVKEKYPETEPVEDLFEEQ